MKLVFNYVCTEELQYFPQAERWGGRETFLRLVQTHIGCETKYRIREEPLELSCESSELPEPNYYEVQHINRVGLKRSLSRVLKSGAEFILRSSLKECRVCRPVILSQPHRWGICRYDGSQIHIERSVRRHQVRVPSEDWIHCLQWVPIYILDPKPIYKGVQKCIGSAPHRRSGLKSFVVVAKSGPAEFMKAAI